MSAWFDWLVSSPVFDSVHTILRDLPPWMIPAARKSLRSATESKQSERHLFGLLSARVPSSSSAKE
ncbi:hypothetical protein Slin15195_G021560 [Septoria linicola]|uniref:Uncharacterized protein n=1 Tax=Septoria linicola TaxID=215465 RepID=A0A9Q9AMP3_9PEZI|nr:hypothetical protein Slin15195_G021560 [Septoria linicola]